MAIDIGLIAYNKYVEQIMRQLKDCDFPLWQELGKVEQDAWRAAAVSVLKYIDTERDKLKKEVDDKLSQLQNLAKNVNDLFWNNPDPTNDEFYDSVVKMNNFLNENK